MRAPPGARDPGLVKELENEAGACEVVQPKVADRLREMADAMRSIHGLLRKFAEVKDMSTLLKWYQLSPVCFSSEFFPLVDSFLSDAETVNDTVRVNSIRHALEIRTRLVSVVKALPTMKIAEEIEREPLLIDPAFHDFLETLSRALAGSDDNGADGARHAAEGLRYATRLHIAGKKLEGLEPHEGMVRVRLPSSPVAAELWFLIDRDTADRLKMLADGVASKRIPLDEGLKSANTIVGSALAPESSAMVTVYSTAAFCEHLLWTGRTEVVPQTIDLYRGLLDGEAAAEIEIESRATFVLRYAGAVVRSWRQLPDSDAVLSDAVSKITRALSTVSEAVSPRLVRDLHFARARLLENLAIRNRDLYVAAEKDYRAGLAVKAVAHESEARGRALGDLANTIARAHSGDSGEYNDQITELSDEALRLLSAEDSTLSRATVLTSYAGHLMDRLPGDPASDIEKALALVTEAITILEEKFPPAERSPYVKETLAGAYLNRGNAIRVRAHGDIDENLAAALESYRVALDIVRERKNDQLLGTILINMGSGWVDRFDLSRDKAYLRNAVYFFTDAAEVLKEFPRERGYVLFRRALIATLTEEESDLDDALKDAQMAADILRPTGDSETFAAAKSAIGILLKHRSKQTDCVDLEQSALELAEAHEIFAQCADSGRAILTARHLADVKIALYRLRGNAIDLEKAKESLSKACEQIEMLWDRSDSMEWRADVSVKYARIYDERAWCEAVCGTDPLHVLQIASSSRAREMVAHVSGLQQRRAYMSPEVASYLDLMRVERQRAEISRWSANRKIAAGQHIAETIRLTEEERSRLRDRISLFQRSGHLLIEETGSRIAQFLQMNRAAILCDLIVTRWGSVAILADATGTKAVQLPDVNTTAIGHWLEGKQGEADWFELVEASRDERKTRRVEWAKAMDRVLSKVGAQIARPIVDSIADAENRFFLLSPGSLTGIPIHAAPVRSGRRVFEQFRGLAYVPSPAILQPAVYEWTVRGPALCILSDPATSPSEELTFAPRELSEVATILVQNDVSVTVLAAIGSGIGRDVFESRGVFVPKEVTILELRPTREWLLENMSRFAHVFYTGHGVGREGPGSGLILPGPGGLRLSNEDVLGMRELTLRPFVYLSACETAREASGSMELFSFASTLVRSGAGFVMGTMWSVTDDCSRMFTERFYRSLVAPTAVPVAFCTSLRQLISDRAAMGTDSAGVSLDHPIYWAGFVPVLGA
jgi:hypothetical protein